MHDHFEIERLVYRYATCVDAGDFGGVAELFADGRMLTPDGAVLAEGYDDVLDLYQKMIRLYPDGNTPLTQHVMSNLAVEINDDAGDARSRCNFTVLQKTDDMPLQTIITGQYEDMFKRRDGIWRFGERRSIPLLVGDLSRHLTREI